MPTTLTGLLLFVVLLLPGFAYLVGKERAGTERRTSPFRETVSIVAASVTTELVVVIASAKWWTGSIDVNAFIIDPGGYWRNNPALVAKWGLGLLAASTVGAYVFTWPRVRRFVNWITRSQYPHPSTVSSWWVLFEETPSRLKVKYKRDDLIARAACYMSDGSMVEGTVKDFNQLADEIPDRDLILEAPIDRSAPDGPRQRMKSQLACLSARDITALLVYFRPRPSSPALSEGESGA